MKRITTLISILAFLLLPVFAEQSAQQQMAVSQKISAGAFSPSDISGLKVWLKADAITGLSDGDPVTTWSDSSGNGNDATADTANKPTYETNVLNSLPVIRFSSDTNRRLKTALFSSALTQPTTVFIVFKASSDANMIFLDGLNNGSRQAVYKTATPFNVSIWANASEVNSSNWGTTNFFYASVYFDNFGGELFKNGVSNAVGIVGTNNLDGLSVGGAYDGSLPANADIAEVLIYNSRLSLGNQQSVEGYLASKYAF